MPNYSPEMKASIAAMLAAKARDRKSVDDPVTRYVLDMQGGERLDTAADVAKREAAARAVAARKKMQQQEQERQKAIDNELAGAAWYGWARPPGMETEQFVPRDKLSDETRAKLEAAQPRGGLPFMGFDKSRLSPEAMAALDRLMAAREPAAIQASPAPMFAAGRAEQPSQLQGTREEILRALAAEKMRNQGSR